MKKLILLLAIFFISCSPDEIKQEQYQYQHTCYKILSRGDDDRGNFIIIKYQEFNNKRYQVDNYKDYIGKNEICDLSNLIEQPL